MTSYRYWRLWHGNEAKGSFSIVFTINLVRMHVWRMFESGLSCVTPDVLTYPCSQELLNARVILQAIRLALDSLVITRAWSFSTEAVLSNLTSGNNYFPTFVNLTPIPFLPPILTLFFLAFISLNPFTARVLDGVLKGDCNFCVCGRNPMMWPLKWELPACTYTWYFLFFKMVENEIWKSGRNLPLTTFSSEHTR